MCMEGENIVSTPSAVVRTSLQRTIGGYRPELPHTGDMEMWLRCGAQGAIGIIEAYQAHYRVHGENMSLGFAGTRDLRQRKAAFDKVFQEYGDLIPNRDELQATCQSRRSRVKLLDCQQTVRPERTVQVP